MKNVQCSFANLSLKRHGPMRVRSRLKTCFGFSFAGLYIGRRAGRVCRRVCVILCFTMPPSSSRHPLILSIQPSG